MQRLPLYATVVDAPVEVVVPCDLNHECTACSLGRRTVRRCVPAEGAPGGLLVVGEAPGKRENDIPPHGRPFMGDAGVLLRRVLAKHWKGPVCLDYAVRCFPGADGIEPEHVEACRPYLAKTLQEVLPSRVVALGSNAASGLLGRSVLPATTRRGYAWLPGSLVPVYLLPTPGSTLRNHWLKRWWSEDLEWALTSPDPPAPPWRAVVNVVVTAADAVAADQAIRQAVAGGAGWFAFDVETEGHMWDEGFRILSAAVAVPGDDTSWVWGADALLDPQATDVLRRLFHDQAVPKVGQNVKFDCLAVRSGLGVEVRGVVGDTRLWRKLQFSEADGHLARMADMVGMGGHKEDAEAALAHARKRVGAAMRSIRKGSDKFEPLSPALEAALRLGLEVDLPKYLYGMLDPDVLYPYNARDAVATARLGALLQGQLRGDHQWRVWDTIMRRAVVAVEQVEAWGIACSPDAVKAFQAHLAVRVEAAQAGFAQYEFNPASPKSVGELLYKKLGLPVLKRTDGGAPSTDAETLEQLQHQHPVVAGLLEWRRLTKLKGTYADGLWGHIRPDGRVHPNLKLDGARSGRLSCEDPNLQNIPRASSPEGKMARDCFIAPDGFVLVQLDYGQLELRVAAALSGDPVMQAIFAEGVDYHKRTAEMVSKLAWGIPPEAVTKEHRSQAKAINFGVLYGLGDAGLAAQMGCSPDQAAQVRQAIMGKFRTLDRWIKACLRETQQTGLAWTWWEGQKFRKRDLWRVADQDDKQRSVAEHSSWNTPIQGTASDYCLASVCAVVEWIRAAGLERDVKLVLTVHDSIMLEVREALVPMVVERVRAIMLGWNSGGVPLDVDVEVGAAWGSVEKYDRGGPAVAPPPKAKVTP